MTGAPKTNPRPLAEVEAELRRAENAMDALVFGLRQGLKPDRSWAGSIRAVNEHIAELRSEKEAAHGK
jgi:hypothetical protein